MAPITPAPLTLMRKVGITSLALGVQISKATRGLECWLGLSWGCCLPVLDELDPRSPLLDQFRSLQGWRHTQPCSSVLVPHLGMILDNPTP